MKYLYLATALALLVSFAASRSKTWMALKLSVKRFKNILPAFLMMLVMVAVLLYFIPDALILKALSNPDRFVSVCMAALIGSATLIPGFIAYPLCGILLSKGVPYMVLSAFSTTLMMVGVASFPVEKAYFGARVALARNLISLAVALIVAIATGLVYKEIGF